MTRKRFIRLAMQLRYQRNAAHRLADIAMALEVSYDVAYRVFGIHELARIRAEVRALERDQRKRERMASE